MSLTRTRGGCRDESALAPVSQPFVLILLGGCGEDATEAKCDVVSECLEEGS